MSDIIEFTARIADYAEGSFTARLVPFHETSRDGRSEFVRGSLSSSGSIPLTIDHGDSVLDRVGVLERFFETADGAYGDFQLADTPKAQELRSLMMQGAVTDVSVGVRVESHNDGLMVGQLDHVSLVSTGAFGSATNPSKVLAVHTEESEPAMPEATETVTPDVVTYDDTDLRSELTLMSDKIDTLTIANVVEPPVFKDLSEFVSTSIMAGVGDADAVAKMATYALEVDNTTTAAGVVPDFLSQEYLSIIADSRAFVNNIPQDPIGAAGMSVVYPKKTSGPSVGVQATENLEVSSTALVIGALSVDLLTYAGANRVSNQLISRSQPGFVEILLRELAGQYASVTDTASILAAVTAADGTAILADLGADAAATFAAFSVANAAIITGVRRPADTVWLASDRWAQLNSLVDGDGRPLLVFGANGPMNAQGQSQFNTMVAQYHGWIVRLDVDAADGTCLIGWSPSVANLEQAPVSLSALQVDTLSTEIGIAGLQSVVIKFDTGLYTLTAA